MRRPGNLCGCRLCCQDCCCCCCWAGAPPEGVPCVGAPVPTLPHGDACRVQHDKSAPRNENAAKEESMETNACRQCADTYVAKVEARSAAGAPFPHHRMK